MGERDLRARVMDATFAEVAQNGLGGLTVEAVASRAGSSRATIYRHFPGGRDELVMSTLRREVGRFFDRLAASLPPGADLVARVAALVTGARRLLGEHEVLQRLLVDEAEELMPPLAMVHPLVQEAVSGLLREAFEAASVSADVEAAADHCARMLLSYVGAGGVWDLDDPDDVRRMVSTRILAGVV